MPYFGTVPNKAWPWLSEKNYPDPGALEVGNAAQTLASLLRAQTAKGEQGALSLECSPLRHSVIVVVRAHYGGELIRIGGIRDTAEIHSTSSWMNSYHRGSDHLCLPLSNIVYSGAAACVFLKTIGQMFLDDTGLSDLSALCNAVAPVPDAANSGAN
jgi:hypothetical protein